MNLGESTEHEVAEKETAAHISVVFFYRKECISNYVCASAVKMSRDHRMKFIWKLFNCATRYMKLAV